MSYPRTLFLLALLAAFPPCPTTMYLPAWPMLHHGWLLLQLGFAGILAGGLAIAVLGVCGPISFSVRTFLLTFCIGLTRPMSNNLVFEQVNEDVGAAASLLVFWYIRHRRRGHGADIPGLDKPRAGHRLAGSRLRRYFITGFPVDGPLLERCSPNRKAGFVRIDMSWRRGERTV